MNFQTGDQQMSLLISVMLFVGAVVTTGYILFKIRRSKVQIEDSIFWLFFSLMILVLSIFPDLAIMAALRLGVESPVNFVFLVVLFALIVHQFFLTLRLSQTNNRLKEIVQRKALDDFDLANREEDKQENIRRDGE